jgi:hypothetical protein
MIRFINCMKRRPEMSVEQFRQFWNSAEFDNLIRQNVALSGAKRYSKNATLVVEANTLIRERRGSSEPFDGVLEYWWDNAAHLTEMLNSPQYQALIQKMLTYQQQFIDVANSSGFFTEAS